MEDQSSTDGKLVGFWVPGVKRSGNHSQNGTESRYKEAKSPLSIGSLRKTKSYQAKCSKMYVICFKKCISFFLGLGAQLIELIDNIRPWLTWNTSHSTAENG